MVDDDKFRVYSQDRRIQLLGAIGDATSFHILDEMVTSDNCFDCSRLLSCSWLGIVGLDAYLKKIPGKVTLVNVPAGVYRYLRLIPGCGENYQIESFQAEFFEPEKPLKQTILETISDNELITAQSGLKKNSFFHTRKGLQLVGPVNQWAPSLFGQSVEPSFKGEWASSHADEMIFWQNFLQFWSSTLGLSLDLIDSQKVSLSFLIQRILGRVECATKALSHAVKVDTSVGDKLRKYLKVVDEECSQNRVALSRSVANMEKLVRKLQSYCEDPKLKSGVKVYDVIRRACEAVRKLEEHLPAIEDAGAKLGTELRRTIQVSKLLDLVDQVDESKLTPEILEEIRGDFNILDPFSEGSWEDTSVEIIDDLKTAQKEMDSCSVILQGFDLLKQVVEHRLGEADLLTDFLPKLKLDFDWKSIREKQYVQITKHLVTDQEKYSMAFFLPDGLEKVADQETSAPGDCLFF